MQTIPRRSFLASAALVAGAAAFPFHAFAAGGRAHKKAIMWETVGFKGSVMEKFKAIKEAGIAGVEPSSHMNQDEVVAARDATGLGIASVCCSTHWGKPVSDPRPEVRAAGVAGLKQALRDAKRYGATSVLFVPAVVSKDVSYADAWTRSQAAIRECIPLAEELGVTIAIENVWNNFLLSPLEAARYVDDFNSKAVGWHFDCGNIANNGFPDQWIRILGKRIAKIHIKEFSRKKADKEGKWAGFNAALTEGDMDWAAVMKALDDIGYTGWIIAEQGGVGSPEALKDLAARMDKIIAA